MVSIDDVTDRPPRAVADGEVLTLGKRSVRWSDTPHLPHAWDCGLMVETTAFGSPRTQRGVTAICDHHSYLSGNRPLPLREASGRAVRGVDFETTAAARRTVWTLC